MSISSDIQKVLKTVAAKERIKVLSTKIHGQNKKGEGFLGNVYFITVEDKEKPNKKLELVVKEATSQRNVRNVFPVSFLYANECMFYDKVWPILQNLQKGIPGGIIFDKVPLCYVTDTTEGHETLVLENLKAKKYETLHKRDCFSEQHLKNIFEMYGKFHALSIALKSKNDRLFTDIAENCFDYLSELSNIQLVKDSIQSIIDKSMGFLKEENEKEIIMKFEGYVAFANEIHARCTNYTGYNGVIVHGDCWSNNIMFKYKENIESREIEDIKFIDFQFSRVGSPVYDLSYCFYSGGTEEIYEDLESYLQIYHTSLSKSLQKFDCDPEVLFPYSNLKREWLEYSQYGFIMGLLLLGAKLVEDGKDMTLSEIVDKPEETRGRTNEKETKKRALALIRHMYKNDFL